MTLNVKTYKWTDYGAPLCYGSGSQFINLITTIMTTGYNNQTVTSLTRVGTLATCTTTAAHNFTVGQCLLISGATPYEWNTEIYVLSVPTSTTFTFTCNSSLTTPATGTITVKVAPLGWTPTTISGITYYRMTDGTMSYLGVPTSSSNFATVYLCKNPPNTGTAISIAVSNTIDTVYRPWVIVGNGKTLFWWCEPASTLGAAGAVAYFGDLRTSVSKDYSATLYVGATGVTPGSSNTFYTGSTALTTAITTHGLMGSIGVSFYDPLNDGTAVSAGKFMSGYQDGNAQTTLCAGSYAFFPSQPDAGITLYPITVYESGLALIRGTMYGIWSYPYANGYMGFTNFITMPGTGTLSGRTFLCLRTYSSGGVIVETSNTWEIPYG